MIVLAHQEGTPGRTQFSVLGRLTDKQAGTVCFQFNAFPSVFQDIDNNDAGGTPLSSAFIPNPPPNTVSATARQSPTVFSGRFELFHIRLTASIPTASPKPEAGDHIPHTKPTKCITNNPQFGRHGYLQRRCSGRTIQFFRHTKYLKHSALPAIGSQPVPPATVGSCARASASNVSSDQDCPFWV